MALWRRNKKKKTKIERRRQCDKCIQACEMVYNLHSLDNTRSKYTYTQNIMSLCGCSLCMKFNRKVLSCFVNILFCLLCSRTCSRMLLEFFVSFFFLLRIYYFHCGSARACFSLMRKAVGKICTVCVHIRCHCHTHKCKMKPHPFLE